MKEQWEEVGNSPFPKPVRRIFDGKNLLSLASMTEFYGGWNQEIQTTIANALASIEGEFTPKKAYEAMRELKKCLKTLSDYMPVEFTRSKVKWQKVWDLANESTYGIPSSTFEILRQWLADLKLAIAEDSHQTIYLVLSATERSYYTDTVQFGKTAHVKFKAIAGDIDEAYKSVALQRHTACVFHCMRILEFGVHRLADHFGISLSVVNSRGKTVSKEWGPLCDEIVSHVKNLPDSTPTEQALRLNFEDVVEHLQNVRMERNRVMHARYATTKRYKGSKAINVLEETKDFVEKLALLLP